MRSKYVSEQSRMTWQGLCSFSVLHQGHLGSSARGKEPAPAVVSVRSSRNIPARYLNAAQSRLSLARPYNRVGVAACKQTYSQAACAIAFVAETMHVCRLAVYSGPCQSIMGEHACS